MDWLNHLIAIVALAVSCALWVLLQRWIARKSPELPGVGRRCQDCTCGSDEAERCEASDAHSHDEPPQTS